MRVRAAGCERALGNRLPQAAAGAASRDKVPPTVSIREIMHASGCYIAIYSSHISTCINSRRLLIFLLPTANIILIILMLRILILMFLLPTANIILIILILRIYIY